MLKKINFSTMLFAVLICATAAKDIPLEWNCRYDSTVPRETVIDRNKLDSLAGISKTDALDVYAVTAAGETKLDTKVLDSNINGVEMLRFTVPAGTQKLFARNTDKKIIKSCANNTDNIFANALKNTSKWSKAAVVSVKKSDNGVVFKLNKHGHYSVKYTVVLPEGYAGTPAKLEFTVKSLSKLTWGNATRVEQYDKNNKLLPESLTDPRWISLMRAPGVKTHHIETGYFHKDAKKITFVFEMVAPKYEHDNHGIKIKDHSISLPEVELSKLAVRKAADLPFPAFDKRFFPAGISEKKGDTALNLDGRTIFFFTPNSHAVYAEGKQIRSEKDTFWPVNDATVELWVKPTWNKNEKRDLIIITAMNRDREDRKNYKKNFGEMFSVVYSTSNGKWRVLLKDADLTDKVFRFTQALENGKWAHLAFQYGKDGVFCFINGKKVFCDNKFSFKPRNIFTEKNRNGLSVQQVEFGGNRGMNRAMFDKEKSIPMVPFQMDLVRISSGKRYDSDFTPAKEMTLDENTTALFNFDSSIDGKSAWGQGNISGSINHKFLPLSARSFTIGKDEIQYFPAELQAHSDPDKVLNKLNYPNLPTVGDFKAARKESVVKYSAKNGKIQKLTLPANSCMDYVEIACPAGVKLLSHPIVIANDELDSRSFGDLADSLKLDKVSEKDRANIIFNLVLKASDYFMTNQVAFLPHTDSVKRADYLALSMLNNYCGFECGPLNNMTANMFTCSGYLPATMIGGYGHAFEQVFYDGKNHVYDLSAQRFFPSHDNETAASLRQLDVENGPFQRYGSSGGAFIRQGVSRWYARHTPVMQKRIACDLRQGEKIRYYFYNNGQYNDIQNKRCVDPNAVHPHDKFPYPKELSVIKDAPQEVIAKEKLYKVYRPFPHYSNVFLTFSGKPADAKQTFSRITKDDFCYTVDVPHPVVAASYKAVTVDGKIADIEISTDGAKSFRKLITDKNGLATYAVRARQGYIIKVKAPISKVAKFDASTEMMFNSRIQNCQLKSGKNTLLFKSRNNEAADITIAYRSRVKDIEIKDALYSGTIPGNERQLTVVEPGKSVIHTVLGASKKAKIVSSRGVDAVLSDGKLTVTAKKDGKLPRFDFVIIDDNGAKKELTVLIADGIRVSMAKDAKLLKGAKMAPAGKERIQDCIMLNKYGDKVRFNFKKIPAGKYLVWNLTRIPTTEKRISVLAMMLPNKKSFKIMQTIHSGNEFYKAAYGKKIGRFRWDAALDSDQNKYPYHSPRFTELPECDGLTLQTIQNMSTEIAALVIIPETDFEFRSEMVKVMCGLNCEPWKIQNHQSGK